MVKNCHEETVSTSKTTHHIRVTRTFLPKIWEEIWEKWTSLFMVVLMHCWKGHWKHCYWSHHSHEKYFTRHIKVHWTDCIRQQTSILGWKSFQNSWEKTNVEWPWPLYPQAMGRLNVQWKLIKVCWRRRRPIPGVAIVQSQTLADRIESVWAACGPQFQSFENNSSLKLQLVHLFMREISSKSRDIREYWTCVTQLGSYRS